jgi:hypothetical protein
MKLFTIYFFRFHNKYYNTGTLDLYSSKNTWIRKLYLIEMCNPIQLVVRLSGRDGGEVVEGLEVAAVPDVGGQPGQQAAALGQARQNLYLRGSPLGKCLAGLHEVLVHLQAREEDYWMKAVFWIR